jgi:hypothetical protein
MSAAAQQHNWTEFLKFYNKQNAGRKTRLGIFEGENDYWLENGLPLSGLDVDTRGDAPTIEIMLGDFTHVVENAREINARFSFDGSGDGLDITGAEGKTTVLRFDQSRR